MMFSMVPTLWAPCYLSERRVRKEDMTDGTVTYDGDLLIITDYRESEKDARA